MVVFSPQNTIGPGNVISGNLRGVLISGRDRDQEPGPGQPDRHRRHGRVRPGQRRAKAIRIEDATDNVVQGDAKGSQVISGNLIRASSSSAPASTRNLVEGNLIGTDKTGLNAVPNCPGGHPDRWAPGQHDRRHHGGGAEPDLGQPLGRQARRRHGDEQPHARATSSAPTSPARSPLGNEIDGVIVSNNASSNTIGGTAAGAGNTIAFNVLAGVSVGSGTGNSILSNSIFSNGKLGIDLVARRRPGQRSHSQPAGSHARSQ